MTTVGLLPVDASDFYPAICGPASLPLIEEDEMISLLEKAAESELDGLVTCLIKKGGVTCQLKRLNTFRDNHPHHRVYARDIAAEIQKYGANTLASVFRSGRGVPYDEIVRDVASKLGLRSHGPIEDVEASIQAKLLQNLWKDLTPNQRQALLEEFDVRDLALITKAALPAVLIEATRLSGFGAYKMSVILANAAAHALLGHGLTFAANATLTKGLSILIGPVGWGIAGLLAAQSIGSEAYRVTIPCVLQISMIRRAIRERERRTDEPKAPKIGPYIVAVGIMLLLVLSLLVWHPW
jgi:uncharacterized protein YaaW (UPF0174 family)